MSNEKSTNQKLNETLFKHQEPIAPKGSRAVVGDPELDETLEDEVEEIDALEQEACVAEPDQCSLCELKHQVESLKETLQESREKLLRAHAEMENVRNRAVSDVEKAHKFGIEKYVKELLPVVDSLEHALNSAEHPEDPFVQALVEGVELTLKMFLDVMGKFGVKQINPLHEPFDPAFHEAMSILPNPEVDPNTVLEVFQVGYALNGRLVRPARVIVSK